MNVFTASDLEAAGLLALAQPGDDGAPPTVTPPLASDGRRRHAIHLAGTGQVTASQAAVIAAAPGRARQQLTPALVGVGSAVHSPPSARPGRRRSGGRPRGARLYP